MHPATLALLITMISTSTIITMSSHHWILAWIGLELNTISILPIMMKPHHPRATEATTKYFIIQTLAAALILFASTINAWQTGQWTIMMSTSTVANNILLAALLLKMGIAPAHLWYPDIIQGTTMMTAMVISTWQKLAPLTLLYLTINNMQTNTLILVGTLSVMIGGLVGLNQTQTRKIMALSSIAHMGWLLIALAMNPSLATLTMSLYLLMTTTIFLCLNMTATKTLMDLSTASSQSPVLMTTTSIALLSLGGLPPLTGFMPKLLILKELTMMKTPLLATTLALASLPSLYFYTRMVYLTTLTTPPNVHCTKYKWRLKTNKKTYMTITTTLATMILPLTPLLYTTH
uniref:NADH-ubiquinone oxidoreductase chain 2 n=1 Tax=Chondrodactylus fitzsimonsi TaxID=1127032 RepID=G9HTQ8_9SAUR|nr:NADH dehydrogenase subunit 2 [Chondrodactylus fitzsimonsi]